jgi:hypothetical protein
VDPHDPAAPLRVPHQPASAAAGISPPMGTVCPYADKMIRADRMAAPAADVLIST